MYLNSHPAQLPTPVKIQVDALSVRVYQQESDLADDAAQIVHDYLKDKIAENGSAAVILATGNSQIRFLKALIDLGGVDWSKITVFHLDEYLGIDANHSASFRRYLRERVEKLVKPKYFHYLEGDALEPLTECDRYTKLLQAQPIDLCCLGVGENGHLAFNDPTVANFNDPDRVKLVKLEDSCRLQQVNEGHFPNLEAVPQYAFTLTISQVCAANKIICLAPEKRKASIVKQMLQSEISTNIPASILRKQPQATLFLDNDSASYLKKL